MKFAITLFISDVTWQRCRRTKKHNLVPIGLWARAPVQSQRRGPENEFERNDDLTAADNVKEKPKNWIHLPFLLLRYINWLYVIYVIKSFRPFWRVETVVPINLDSISLFSGDFSRWGVAEFFQRWMRRAADITVFRRMWPDFDSSYHERHEVDRRPLF